MNVNIGTIVVDNPAEYAERVINPRITAARSLRDDPLGQMHERRQVSASQYKAGRIWQSTWEVAAVGSIRSQDPSVEPVDGGGHVPTGITDRHLAAMKKLARWHAGLGTDGARIIEMVLADKRTIREVAAHRYGPLTRASVIYAGRRFRECLDALARGMGLA